MSKLFLVGTPIGNLSDLSPRAIETLTTVDFIAAEDTRVTIKLLNRFAISKPMISYYEHNIRERGEEIVGRIKNGESCALVTDAGMPAISDPGEDLVRLCATHGIEVIAIPGPSAVVTALALSGLDTKRFCFEGFISTNKQSRREHLLSLKQERHTMVFYEAPHKLRATLADLVKTFGAERKISLCRELTKIHEEAIRTTLGEAVTYYENIAPRGEFVLVVEGETQKAEKLMFIEDAVMLAKTLMENGEKASSAAKEAAAVTGCKKGDIYKLLISQ